MIERLLSSSVIKTLNLSSSLFCLLLLLFLQLFSLCLKLWLDRPSVLASFLIGRRHPGSEAVIGRCGILLQSSGVLTLPDVRPAAGWQSSEPALRLDTQMHDEAEFLRGSSSVGFLVGGRSSQVKESERDRRMWSSMKTTDLTWWMKSESDSLDSAKLPAHSSGFTDCNFLDLVSASHWTNLRFSPSGRKVHVQSYVIRILKKR